MSQIIEVISLLAPDGAYGALSDVTIELFKQDEKWGENRVMPDTLWYTILGEEVGEVGKDILERKQSVRDELVQVAALCVNWIKAIDRNEVTEYKMA